MHTCFSEKETTLSSSTSPQDYMEHLGRKKAYLIAYLSLPRENKAEITLHFPFLLIWAHTSLEMSRLSCWDLGVELFCQLILAGKESAYYKVHGGANSVESFIKKANEDSWVEGFLHE